MLKAITAIPAPPLCCSGVAIKIEIASFEAPEAPSLEELICPSERGGKSRFCGADAEHACCSLDTKAADAEMAPASYVAYRLQQLMHRVKLRADVAGARLAA
jgi:hypothetical protein